MARTAAATVSKDRAYWSSEITKAKKRFRTFHDDGERAIDEYRMQKADGNATSTKDKYNILYSSTETIRPNLYAQKPTVRVQLRHKDRASRAARDAVLLLSSCLSYVVEEDDFDEVMECCVEDLILPGMGTAWVLYEPAFETLYGEDKKPQLDEAGEEMQRLLDEKVRFEHVYWADFLTGMSRGWRTVPWVAKRCWMGKEAVEKRFGTEKAAQISFKSSRRELSRDDEAEQNTAEIWEIWDKSSKTVFWYCENYAGDVLDKKPDPLRLRDFFPCPRPMRAISNTRTFVPRALYSQYKTQQEQMNELTKRIRLLTEALKVVGVYDQSQPALANIISAGSGNKMVPVDSWVSFTQQGGIKGSVEWLPIEQVAAVLLQLLQAREICKNEIYEITGFSDIVRGVSKASETLGAQNIKVNWASARVKRMQKEVQRFARDCIAIAGEVIAEHCQEASLALFGGVDMPTPEALQQQPELQELLMRFKEAVKMLRDEGRRVASVDIETDSTILADEQAERKDRSEFLSAAGAFLQQAVPAMTATPELGPLLGAMLMFVVRTFPSSRPIEEEFEKVQKVLAGGPPKPQGDDGKAKAEAATNVANIKAGADTQKAQTDAEVKKYDIDNRTKTDLAELAATQQAEANRHAEAMQTLALKERELSLREREVAVKERELGIKQQDANTRAEAVDNNAVIAERQVLADEAEAANPAETGEPGA